MAVALTRPTFAGCLGLVEQGQLNEFHEKLSNLDRELDAEALKRKADAEDVEGLSREEEKARKKRKLLEDLVRRAPPLTGVQANWHVLNGQPF